jgi:hypothetical protein
MSETTDIRTMTLTNQVMFGTEYEIGFEEDSYGYSGLYSYGFVGRELVDGEISFE